jgi:hypothetical protein
VWDSSECHAGNRQWQEGKGPERGTDCDEGKTLKGEAHGRSDAQASGGSEVIAAQGVTKPRTWRVAAEGSAVETRILWPGTVS